MCSLEKKIESTLIKHPQLAANKKEKKRNVIDFSTGYYKSISIYQAANIESQVIAGENNRRKEHANPQKSSF